MKFILSFYTKAWTLSVPLTLLLVGCPLLCATDVLTVDQATIVSQMGTVVVLLINAVYIVFWHSKKRWKNASALERAGNLFTFKQ